MKKIWVFCVVLAVLATSSARAAYRLVDDFKSYSVGTYSGGSTAFAAYGGPWRSSNGGASDLLAIENDGNNHLAWGWGAGLRGANRTVPKIANGEVGTYYFRIRTRDAMPDVSYGLSDVAAGALTDFEDFEVQVALTYEPASGIRLGARNGASVELDLVTGLRANIWYDIWIVVDNATDTFDLYYGTSGDPKAMGTLVAKKFGFRNGAAANDLITFMTLSKNHEDLNAHLGNIYYHSGAGNPGAIAKPAVIGLISIFGVGLLLLRRCCAE